MNFDSDSILTIILFAAAIVAVYDCVRGDEYGVIGKTLWVLFIVIIPLFGIFFYCLFSRRKKRRMVRKKYDRLKRKNEGRAS